ncbi:tannase/feruloyl esterase family alpha/beta hydrolase [Marinomonas sp. TW1]|uniref:tannase/feruloyl esterase family alpha/beta hydrolase n=1 Tax=Marinomonas sp. TW1 TaxID=1561203 RepID=UPI0007AF47FA|nr:tannase/feruloyl esterase family alpha/beta hydrolase [Marinomonas sp. TW1]KZN14060.1 esterase [Marinomonas sp. TW1]
MERNSAYKPLLVTLLSSVFLTACSSSSSSTAQLSPASPERLTQQCEAFADQLAYQNTSILSVESIAKGDVSVAGKAIGEHCLVKGEMNRRISSVDGKEYAIGFEVRLPKTWNGRLLYQANGGLDGSVKPAEGGFAGGPITNALYQGFAVISSDAGHDRPLPTFGYDPQARLDYGYQAVGSLTPMVKSVVSQVYGKAPDRSYFAGCSNGGRHAMVAATRYADQYDGFLVGAPGYRLPLAATANIAGAQVYASVPGTTQADLSAAFTLQERQLVSKAVLKQCDGLDGLKDGLIQDFNACQSAFDLDRDVPSCHVGRDGSCLTPEQKNAVTTIFDGVRLSNGERVYASFPYDAGISNQGQMNWEYSAPMKRDSGAVSMIFQTPPVELKDLSIRNFNGSEYVFNADIDELVKKVYATEGIYQEASMRFMTPQNPENMSVMRDRGGKIMVYHGVSDPIFSVQDTQDWYLALDQENQGKAGQFAQFYPVPGMAHCRGGQSVDQFDMLTPLVNWVEKGEQPEQVMASARGKNNPGGENKELPDDWSENRTRPLCPFPTVASYDGKGDPESAASFTCK